MSVAGDGAGAGAGRAVAHRPAEPDRTEIAAVVERAVQEDLGDGDLTVRAVVPPEAVVSARLDQKAPGVVAGLGVARAVFEHLDPAIRWREHLDEGVWREEGLVAEVEGPAAAVLAGERVALNLLGHLSGVATLTARHVAAVAGTRARILDTRKTGPGLRALERRAVRAGGGVNHRAGLYDAILVKENHALLAGGVGEATRRALAAVDQGAFVEIECTSLDEVAEALAAGAPIILLDNTSLDELRAAVELVAGRATLEASGGVSLETVRDIAQTGVDGISVGALTHSAPALDLSLTLEPISAYPAA